VTLRRASAPHFPGAGARMEYPMRAFTRRVIASWWHRLRHAAGEWIGPLGNRLDAETQARLLGSVHERIPMVTPDE
jgi:hypothetical protein